MIPLFRNEIQCFLTFLTPTLKRRYVLLLGLMILGALLEMGGIALLLPLLALFNSPELIERSVIGHGVVEALGYPKISTLAMIAIGAFTLVNVLRLGFLVYLGWQQSNFVKNFNVQFSERLYSSYLYQPYSFHLQRNSAQLMQNATGEVAMVGEVVRNSLGLISEAVVLLGITIMLLAVDPLAVMIMVALLGGSAWIFHYQTRLRITRWGQQREQHANKRLKVMQEGLHGVKEVKLMRAEEMVLRDYAPHNLGLAHANQRNTFIQGLPRLWLEMLVILGMGLFVTILLWQEKPLGEVLPILGLFGVAAFRLMPSVSRILGAIQGIRYGIPALWRLSEELVQFGKYRQTNVELVSSKRGQADFTSSIEVQNLVFTYPTGHRPALNNLSLTVYRGEAVGFIGSSGAGKSTLIDVLLGLLRPDEGTIVVDGRSIHDNLRAWQRQLGYVPQSTYLTDDTLFRNIAFGQPNGQIDEAAVHRVLRLAQLEDFVSTLPRGLETVVGERGVRLSGGQRQRIAIARSLYNDPQILMLDEATSALDTETEQALMSAVNALQGTKTLLIVAHRLSTVAKCDRIYRLEKGQIIAHGKPEEVIGGKVRAIKRNKAT